MQFAKRMGLLQVPIPGCVHIILMRHSKGRGEGRSAELLHFSLMHAAGGRPIKTRHVDHAGEAEVRKPGG